MKQLHITLNKFIDKNPSLASLTLDHIALKHPETREKIYIISQWAAGFWFRKTKGSANENGPIYPCQYSKNVLELEVHEDAWEELA